MKEDDYSSLKSKKTSNRSVYRKYSVEFKQQILDEVKA
jgi:hypothetical protein